VKNNLKLFLTIFAFMLSSQIAWAANAAHHDDHATPHTSVQTHAEELHGEEAHAEEDGHGEEGASMHMPNVINVLYHFFPNNNLIHVFHENENILFAVLAALFLSLLLILGARGAKMIPSGLQNLVEFMIESLDNFVCGILGSHGRAFTPFVGTLFLYILFMNVMGLIPGLKSPTSSIGITLPLGIAVFIYVQYTGIRQLGLMGYIDHLTGQPRNIVGYILIPLMLFLHVVGEFVKPVSLALRLFGNVWGEDVLIAVFVGMGGDIFVPLHFPFLLLALLTSFVQAVVFCLLTTVYITLMLPHDEEHHEATSH